MSSLSDPGYIKDVLARHGFRFSKSMGQNFLINPTVCPRMVEACGADGEAGVLEIGPGLGVLTKELSRVAGKVVAVELDRRLFPVLEETLAGCSNVELVQGDVLELDLSELFREKFGGRKVYVCANLPYYITSPVLMGLLERELPLESVTVMVQKEAAQRICARPGARECGAVSASVWYHSEPEILFPVSRGSFLPPPHVDSAVIRLKLRREPPVTVEDKAFFFAIVRQAFAQRRKTAANSIAAGGRFSKAQAEEALALLGAPRDVRAERLSLEQLAELSNKLLAASR